MCVYVKSMRNKPLMPTTPAKARKMLKAGKAEVVKRTPFTIRLLYATGETTQDVTLGIDAGDAHIGVCASTEKEMLLLGIRISSCWKAGKTILQRGGRRFLPQASLWVSTPDVL